MTEGVIAALVAMFGALLSTLISLFVSRKVAANEIQKLVVKARTSFDTRLLEKRLDVYPALFLLLSNFIKEIEFGFVSRDTINKLVNEMNKWDSANAIFFSKISADVCYEFRHYLGNLQKEHDNEVKKHLSSSEFLENLRDRTATVEFVLRSDLCIYGIKPSKNDVYVIMPSLEDIYAPEVVRSLQDAVAKSHKAAKAAGKPKLSNQLERFKL